MLGKKVGIDVGACTARVYVKGDGIVFREPAVVALAPGDGERRVVAAGTAALHAVAEGAELRRPVRAGRVADMAALDAVLHALIARAAGRQRIFRPDIMLVVSSTLPGVDRRTIMDITARAGARTTYLVDAPICAALGAGIPVGSPRAHAIVHLGGEVSEAAVICMEGAVARRVLERGGRHLTAAVARRVGEAHGLALSDAWAEEVKREIGSALPLHEERVLSVPARGDDGASASVSSVEVHGAMAPLLRELSEAVLETLSEVPPPLRDDVRSHGIVLTGGGAALRGIDRMLAAATGLDVRIAADPESCAVRGTAAALDDLEVLRRNSLYVR